MLIFVSLYFICRGPPLSFCTLLGFSLIFLELFFLLFLKLRLIFFVQLQSSYMQGITNCVFLNEIAINMCKVSRFFYLSNIVISVTVKRAVWKIKKLSESPGTLPMVAQLCKNGSKNWQNLSPIYNLHCNREIGQKWGLVIFFDWGPYWQKVNASELHYARSFRDTQLDHIWLAQIRAQNRPNIPNTAKYGQIYLPAIETLVTGLYHSGAKSSVWQARDGPQHRTRVQRGRQGEWLRASGGFSISRTYPSRHWDGGSKLRLDWVIYDYNRLLEFMELCSI